jgi:HK97 gp10 family phage protein
VLPVIHRDAYEEAPKSTGLLAASLHVGFEDETTGFIADGVFYGVFQEEGTRYIAPKHFMRNSVNRNFPRVGKEVTESMKKTFNQ